jgi:hypothetical protein
VDLSRKAWTFTVCGQAQRVPAVGRTSRKRCSISAAVVAYRPRGSRIGLAVRPSPPKITLSHSSSHWSSTNSSSSSKIWTDTQHDRATQLVFSDLSTPDPERFNVYDDIRSKLVAAGIPPREISFIHDAETDTAKKLLFDGVNAGSVRILLGSTEQMGAGTNVQRRLVALHHLDAPWRPRDIEQREGRILRQGNTNKEVQIYRYVTEGSFGAYALS